MTRILIVDDHSLLRRGIVQVLSSGLSNAFVAEAANESEALAAVWSQPWDLVLLEVSLPGRGGVELLKEIKAARPRLAVLVLSSHPESQFARRSLRAGAAGYITKDNPPELLLHAIRTVLAGGKYVSAELAVHLATEFATTDAKLPHESLSDREYSVMLRIASGQGVTKVAEALQLSVKTVSTYRSRILEKMGLGTNAELTQYAFRNKLIE